MSKKFADMTDEERLDAIRDCKFRQRFWAKVHKTGGGEWECWEWTAAENSKGYGRVRVGGGLVYAHRAAYVLAHGLIPDGMQVDHRCGNRSCVRASHLRIVTPQQNQQHRTGLDARNTSGYRGVTWSKQRQKWMAKAKRDGKHMTLGRFDDLEKAAQTVTDYRAEHYTHDDFHAWGTPAV